MKTPESTLVRDAANEGGTVTGLMALATSRAPDRFKDIRARAIYLRDLVLELVGRDVKIQYKRAWFGIFWSLLNPLLQFVVFGFLFSKVLAVSVNRYSAYAFTGVLVWTWFQGALLQGVRTITGNRELVKRPGFPVSILPVVSVLTPGVQFLCALPVLLAFLLLDRAAVSSAILLLPLLMFVQFLFSLSAVYLLGALNVVVRDTQMALALVLQLLLFATPVFYDAKSIPEKYSLFFALNPLAQLIDAYRAVLLHGVLPNFLNLAILLSAGVLLLGLTFQFFVHMSHRFAEEL